MTKKLVWRQQVFSKVYRRAPRIIVKLSFSELKRSYHLAEQEVHDDLLPESFSCSDYAEKRLEHPLIVVRLLRIPGIKEIELDRRAIEVSISKAFRWEEVQPRIIRVLQQMFYSSQPQISTWQEVSGGAHSSSKFRLEKVVQGRLPQLPKKILLDEEKADIRQTQYHLTIPLARRSFWKAGGPGSCRPPGHLKQLIEAILAVPGVTDIWGCPYEISVSCGEVFDKEKTQNQVVDILRKLFPNAASVVVERAQLPGSSLTTDSRERRDTVPGIKWRVSNPASRMLVEAREDNPRTRYFHLGSELADWKSLYDPHEDLPDWLQKPLEQLFGVPGVASIVIEKYSMAVEIAEGFCWSKVQPAVVAILEGIGSLPVQVIYKRRASRVSGKPTKRLPRFTSPGILWRADTALSQKRWYTTSIWPPGASNWYQWKSDDVHHLRRLEEFSPDAQHFIDEMLRAPGVAAVGIRPYAVNVEIGKAFKWAECQSGILLILNSLYPQTERQNILVRKKKWRRAVQLDKPPRYKIGTPRIFIARGFVEKVRDFHLSIPTLFGECWCSDGDSFRKLPRRLRRTMQRLVAGADVKSITVRPWLVQVYRTDATDNASIEKMVIPLLKDLFPQPKDIIVSRLPK